MDASRGGGPDPVPSQPVGAARHPRGGIGFGIPRLGRTRRPRHAASHDPIPPVSGQILGETGPVRQSEQADDSCPLAAAVPAGRSTRVKRAVAEHLASFDATGVTVCVACCATSSWPDEAVRDVTRAVGALAVTRTVLLSESASASRGEEEVIVVPSGTKLSKIRRLADLVKADFFVICDPDLTVHEEGCRVVLRKAMESARDGKEVVAFGVVQGEDDGTLLSQIVAIDKWLSHRVLRPLLWAAGVGITLPGQFLVVSSSLVRSLDPAVDSYLDDLYLGWVARRQGACVLRLPVVVGAESPRRSWTSLLTQRVRWMKGLASLLGHLVVHPSALALLGVHYFAYHGLPILLATLVVLLGSVNLLAGLGVVFCLATVMSFLSGRSIVACVAFLAVFPFVHAVATLAWWVPATRSTLTRR